MSASRSGFYAVSRQIFLSLCCERIYRENLASDRPMQEKPLKTDERSKSKVKFICFALQGGRKRS